MRIGASSVKWKVLSGPKSKVRVFTIIKPYGFAMHRFRCKLSCLSMPVNVTVNNKNTSLRRILTISVHYKSIRCNPARRLWSDNLKFLKLVSHTTYLKNETWHGWDKSLTRKIFIWLKKVRYLKAVEFVWCLKNWRYANAYLLPVLQLSDWITVEVYNFLK